MKKLISTWLLLTNIMIVGVFLLSVSNSTAVEHSGSGLRQEDLNSDPTLAEMSMPETTSPLSIKSDGDQVNLGVETSTLISPYLGVIKKQTDGPDDISSHLGSRSDNILDNYHFETGMGLKVNKQTTVNLGYRLNDSQSQLDDWGHKEPSGDIRFNLKFELPF